MYKGSCLCGAVTYKLISEPKKISSCHCNMCQKQHGAAFATYVGLPESGLVYLSGENQLASYNSSGSVNRKFCKICGSTLEWIDSDKYPGWTSITIGTLDTPYKPKEQAADIYTDTKITWLHSSE